MNPDELAERLKNERHLLVFLHDDCLEIHPSRISEAEIEALNFNLKQMHKEGSVKTGLDEILKNNGIKDA